MDFIERREYFRIKVECDIEYRLLHNTETHKGCCTTLSGAGISFITATALALQDELEILIQSPSPNTPPMLAHSKVVRIVERDDLQFEIGATLTPL